ncbi:hypothetical protein TNCV_2454901 [Trichonephila clavipes]|nr:hypothetical protein TNCV_2454901 [Trichonephila clavipes]
MQSKDLNNVCEGFTYYLLLESHTRAYVGHWRATVEWAVEGFVTNDPDKCPSDHWSDMSSFKKYKCLTIYESVEGERKVDVAKAFEIPLSSLSTILKNKEKIFSASSSRVRKRVSKALPQQDLTFDDYLLVDMDIAVWGALFDAEIVALDHNNTESDEDESEELTPVTVRS